MTKNDFIQLTGKVNIEYLANSVKEIVQTGGNHDYELEFNNKAVIVRNLEGEILGAFKHNNQFETDIDPFNMDFNSMAWELFRAIVKYGDDE